MTSDEVRNVMERLDADNRKHMYELWEFEQASKQRFSRTLAFMVLTVLLHVAMILFATSSARAETLTETEVAQIAVKFFPAREVPRVIRVAQCESGLDTNAVSAGWDRVFGRYAYVSLLQISEDLWQWDANRLFGYPADLRDPVVNIAVGAFIWSVQGWAAWPYCGYR